MTSQTRLGGEPEDRNLHFMGVIVGVVVQRHRTRSSRGDRRRNDRRGVVREVGDLLPLIRGGGRERAREEDGIRTEGKGGSTPRRVL